VSRLAVGVFALLAVATGAAFFFVQHLKVTTPLIAGFPAPKPSVINPVSGVVCDGVNHRQMEISFYLQHRSDDVDVYMIDQAGGIVATLATNHHMPGGAHRRRDYFFWHGRLDDGAYAPDGTYYVQVDLRHQGRKVVISPTNGGPPSPVRVKTHPPRPVVTSVSPQLIPQDGALSVNIRYRGNEGHVATMRVYRTDVPGRPRLVATFLTSGVGTTTWNGKIGNRPAPAGIYLIGMEVTDAACNTGRFPSSFPPPPGSTAHAGVTVRYLAAQPPLDPVRAGTSATVYVDSRRQPYRWALRAAGASKVLEHGSSKGAYTLSVHMPRGSAGLYALTLRTGSHRTTVPLVASAPRPARILVVLPALSWQGLNPVDDTGAGVADTLSAGGPVQLSRPLVRGLPSGFSDEAALIAYLRRAHRAFDLTTDLALLEGAGPRLRGHRGVVLGGQERWIPRLLASALRTYVTGGGRVLSLGLDSLRSYVQVAGTAGTAVASHPTAPAATDIFGVRHGAIVRHDTGLVTTISDGLGLFVNTSGVFPGYSAYEPVLSVSRPGRLAASAGTSTSALSVAGIALGNGSVVEVGLSGFVANLASRLDTRELFDALWSQLTASPASPFS
jgi:hypothetical protein